MIVRKDLEVTKQGRLFDDCMYFFYLTNESPNDLTTNEAVYLALSSLDRRRLS